MDEEIKVIGQRAYDTTLESRPTSTVTKKQIQERQVRSTPDALRGVPGVYVQQTGAGQGSPYIRGRTGQQILLIFDGLRVNNALFRQGPNQYLFTVDSKTIERIEVVRGSASVELGADALGGAVLLHPAGPKIDPYHKGFRFTPRASMAHSTADRSLGARLELDTQLADDTGVLLGVSARRVGRLEAAGPLESPLSEEEVGVPLFEKEVPTFDEDGRTMLGTGFKEVTGDVRAVHRLSADDTLTLAAYLYRQHDSPRTDQCPPPEAPLSDCLVFEEQFRTHIYGKAELRPGWRWLLKTTMAAGFQQQHERRQRDRSETLGVLNGGRDDINVWSGMARMETRLIPLAPGIKVRSEYGIDGSWETVSSAAWTTLSRLEVTRFDPRGQYMEGSRYAQGGAWFSPRFALGDAWIVRLGARAATISASSPGEEESETAALDQTWTALVGNAGVEWRALDELSLKANLEQGFRPPNLDDLTARQPTGRGYQLENPELGPERGLTAEFGARWKREDKQGRGLTIDAWVFQQWVDDAIERRAADCPENDRQCRGSRAAITLVNVDGVAIIRGYELAVTARPLRQLELRGTVAWTWGESDHPDPQVGGRVPLSRVPPMNGVGEITWRGDQGLYFGGATRWARLQDRLSVGDVGDARIPFGGTPGYVAFDLRAGYRLPGRLSMNLVLENLTDEAWRVHGSAVNGPGRGLLFGLALEP